MQFLFFGSSDSKHPFPHHQVPRDTMKLLCRFLDTIDFLFTQGNVWNLHGTYACMTLRLGNTKQGVKLQIKKVAS